MSFSREVLPLLSDNCLSCHGQDAGHRKADLRLDTQEGAREVLKSGDFPDTAHVANTNRVAMSVVADARTGNLIITSAIDNLLKGASGQAVQNMNVMLGLDEATGLL